MTVCWKLLGQASQSMVEKLSFWCISVLIDSESVKAVLLYRLPEPSPNIVNVMYNVRIEELYSTHYTIHNNTIQSHTQYNADNTGA